MTDSRFMKPSRILRITEGPEEGEYVVVDEDGTVLRVGRNPDHLSNWALSVDSEAEVSHEYDCMKWGELPWPRPT